MVGLPDSKRNLRICSAVSTVYRRVSDVQTNGDRHLVTVQFALCIYASRDKNTNKLSYRKQIARKLRTQYIEKIYSNFVTLKSGLEVTQDHSNWYHLKAWV